MSVKEDFFSIHDLEITFLDGLTGMDSKESLKTSHEEILLRCHERYVKKLKSLTPKEVASQGNFLNTFLLPILRDMAKATNNEMKSRGKESKI